MYNKIVSLIQKRSGWNGNSIAIQLKNGIIQKVVHAVETNGFEISDRSKNRQFMRKFRLNFTSIRNILLSLDYSSIIKIDEDRNKTEFGEGAIIICKVRKELINFHGTKEEVTIYIKLKLIEDKMIPIISFHEAEF